nr:hypothetical protein [Tanacetum cinerariifolium]
VAQDLEILKLKIRVKKLERTNKVKTLKLKRLRKVGTSQRVDTSDDTLMEDVSNQGKIIDELDKDEGDVLMSEKEEKETEEVKDITGDAQVEGRQADIYQINMDHAAKVLSMQEDEPEIQEVVEVVTTAKLITEVVAAVSETVSAAAVVPTVTTDVVPAATVTHAPVKRYQMMKKRPQIEAQAQRNMMMYLKNTDGFRLDYFKGMSYDDIRPIFKAKFNSNIEFLLKTKEQIEEEANRAIKSINETPAQKAAKRRKRNEEAEDDEELIRHLEIVPDEDDDVYTEATPLARKVPVVDYQIVHINNKPHFKIIRADETHQLYSNVWKTRWTRSSLDESKKCLWSSKELSTARRKLMLLDSAAEKNNAAKSRKDWKSWPKKNFAHKSVTPRADLFKTASVSVARRVTTAAPRPNVNSARPKTTQDLVIIKLIQRVKRLERELKARTLPTKIHCVDVRGRS